MRIWKIGSTPLTCRSQSGREPCDLLNSSVPPSSPAHLPCYPYYLHLPMIYIASPPQIGRHPTTERDIGIFRDWLAHRCTPFHLPSLLPYMSVHLYIFV